MKLRIRYGILAEVVEVIRWSWSKPSKHYRFTTERVQVKPAVDWSNFEPALF